MDFAGTKKKEVWTQIQKVPKMTKEPYGLC